MPAKVANEINKIQRRFLWNGQKQGRYQALVRWEVIQKPKKKGGLGVADCTLKNAALLFKWWWRFACEEGSLWKRIVTSIHEDDLTILPSTTRSRLPSPWSDIRKLATTETPVKKAFFQNARVCVGEGTKVKFWEDYWAGEAPLKQTFPDLYEVSSQQKERISNMGWFEGETWRWVLSWKRMLTQVESNAEQQLHNILQLHYPSRYTSDRLAWIHNGIFSVKNLYAQAVKQMDNEVTVDRLICSVWQKLAPPKVEFMVWLAVQDKLNTKDRLARRRAIPIEMNICTFCHSHNEDIHHLLLSCQYSWTIWRLIAEDLGKVVAHADDLRNFYASWINVRIANKTRKKIWITSFFATIWSLWMQRNEVIFKQQQLDWQALYHTIKWRVAMWTRAWEEDMPCSVEMLAQNFHAIPRLF